MRSTRATNPETSGEEATATLTPNADQMVGEDASQLTVLARNLGVCADALDAQAREAEAASTEDSSSSIAAAQAEAAQMRALAQKITTELARAPTDARGRKQIAGSLKQDSQRILQHAAQDGCTITTVGSEQKSLASTRATAASISVAEPSKPKKSLKSLSLSTALEPIPASTLKATMPAVPIVAALPKLEPLRAPALLEIAAPAPAPRPLMVAVVEEARTLGQTVSTKVQTMRETVNETTQALVDTYDRAAQNARAMVSSGVTRVQTALRETGESIANFGTDVASKLPVPVVAAVTTVASHVSAVALAPLTLGRNVVKAGEALVDRAGKLFEPAKPAADTKPTPGRMEQALQRVRELVAPAAPLRLEAIPVPKTAIGNLKLPSLPQVFSHDSLPSLPVMP
jgi:hypothetical protein